MKPLSGKAYGTIGHLSASRLGPGDHRVHEGQERILTVKVRDKHDRVIVEQKLDGSCVAVARKDDGGLVTLGRAGHPAVSSPYRQHRMFNDWMWENLDRFMWLERGQRVVGEWLAQAHGTRYTLHHAPFVAFDIFGANGLRLPRDRFREVCIEHGLVMPQLVHDGGAIAPLDAYCLARAEAHGAIDPVEGVVYRVERRGLVDFLAKFVRSSYVPGRFLPDVNPEIKPGGEVWNWTPGSGVRV